MQKTLGQLIDDLSNARREVMRLKGDRDPVVWIESERGVRSTVGDVNVSILNGEVTIESRVSHL